MNSIVPTEAWAGSWLGPEVERDDSGLATEMQK